MNKSAISYWKNTSTDHVSVDLHVGAGQRPMRVEWSPGEVQPLSSDFDTAFEHPRDPRLSEAPQVKRVSGPNGDEDQAPKRKVPPAPSNPIK